MRRGGYPVMRAWVDRAAAANEGCFPVCDEGGGGGALEEHRQQTPERVLRRIP